MEDGPYLTDFDFLSIVVFREEVEAGQTRRVLEALEKVLAPECAIRFFDKIDIVFQGYDDDARDLWEVPEIRKFIYKLDQGFPYWLYFLSKSSKGLMCILLCFLPPYISHDSEIFRSRLAEYIEKRGFPAMNHIAALVGCSEQEIARMSARVFDYLKTGPETFPC